MRPDTSSASSTWQIILVIDGCDQYKLSEVIAKLPRHAEISPVTIRASSAFSSNGMPDDSAIMSLKPAWALSGPFQGADEGAETAFASLIDELARVLLAELPVERAEIRCGSFRRCYRR
jgi:hypothetical protein